MFWIWNSGGNDSNRGGRGRRSGGYTFQPLEQAEDTRITPDMTLAEAELRIRRRIEKRHAERSEFVMSLISFGIVNVIIWAIFANWGMFYFWGFPWPAFVTFFWGINLLRRGYGLYQNSAEVVARRENHFQREVDRMKARMGFNDRYYSDKPKNTDKLKNEQMPDQPIRLTADGELIPDSDDFAALSDDQSDMIDDSYRYRTDQNY